MKAHELYTAVDPALFAGMLDWFRANDRNVYKSAVATLASNRKLTFSSHAQERLFSRNITLSEETVNGIADAIDKAELKGSKETLVLSDEAAFVVSVKNRTVITAFDRDNLREGVVTAIDSAVII